MKTQHLFNASAAAVLAITMAAFAQIPLTASLSTTAQAPQPSSPSTPQPPSPSTPQSPQASAASQAGKQPETPVTLVGCVMRETDYRKSNDKGRGGPVATGLGQGNEFVLVNAAKLTPGATPPGATGQCGPTTAGEAYELSGNREKELEKLLGRRVEITGILKEAKTTAGAAGQPKPTGGFDPLRQDLKLFEVDVTSFRELSATQG
jgi:hypothetical protein